eukprot:403331848
MDLIKIVARGHQINQQADYELAQMIQDSVHRVQSVDNLYDFFDKTLRDFRSSISSYQVQPGSVVSFDCGSVIDLFLRRVLFSFSTMMFEDLYKLFENFVAYRENREYKQLYAKVNLDYWAEDKAFVLENESIKKDYKRVKQEIDSVKAPKFYQKELLYSINDYLGKKDVESVYNLHKYFDYNLNFIDRSAAKPTHLVKVHQPELNMAGMQLRLGMLDQALLSVLETIRISQNKNDHEAILQCLIWLHQILIKVGSRSQERQLIEHIIYQAHQLNNNYLFIVSCVNFSQIDFCKTLKSSNYITHKLAEVFKSIKVMVEGPLWYDILQIANKKIGSLQEQIISRDFVTELKPMLILAKSQIWENIGSKILTRLNVVNIIKVFGPRALNQRSVLNTLYSHLLLLKDQSVQQSIDLVELLLKYGDNIMTLEYQFVFMVAICQFRLNREELFEAQQIEESLEEYITMTRSSTETAIVWILKVKRLLKLQNHNSAHQNINELIKFCSQYGLSCFKLEAELLHCRLYLQLQDYSSAMLIVTKTLASLKENNTGNFGKLRMQAQLLVCEIKNSIPELVYESLQELNELLPSIMENGSKELQLQALKLNGMVNMRMGAIKLSQPSEQDDSLEESKFQEDQDLLQSQQLYTQSFYNQSCRYLQQALKMAVQLQKLNDMREISYLLAIIYNHQYQINLNGQNQSAQFTNLKRDKVSHIFLNADKELRKNQSQDSYRIETVKLNIRALIKQERENLNEFSKIFADI